MHHRIWLLVIVITSTYPAATPQPTIRMGLFFYVKIIEKNSVSKVALIVCYVPDLIILWNRQIESCLQLVFVLQISLLSKNLLCNIFLFLCILFYVYKLLTRSNKKFWISFLQMSMKFLTDCLRHKQTRRTYPSSICTWFLTFSSWNWYLHPNFFFPCLK